MLKALTNFFAGMGACGILAFLLVKYHPFPTGEVIHGCAVPSDGGILMLRVEQYKGKLLAQCSYLPKPFK